MKKDNIVDENEEKKRNILKIVFYMSAFVGFRLNAGTIIGAKNNISSIDDIKKFSESDFWYPISGLAGKVTPREFKKTDRLLNFVGVDGISVELLPLDSSSSEKKGDALQASMVFKLDENYFNKYFIDVYNKNKEHYYLKADNTNIGNGNKLVSGNTITFNGDSNITTKIDDTSNITINLKEELQNIKSISNDKKDGITITTKDSKGNNKSFKFGGDLDSDESVVTNKQFKELEEKTRNLVINSPIIEKLITKNNGNVYVTEDGTLTQLGKSLLYTNSASGRKFIENNNIIQAIGNLNKQGTRFFHVNSKDMPEGKEVNSDINDSSAGSFGSIAIGMKADVASNSKFGISIGSESKVNENSIGGISIGKGSNSSGDSGISFGFNASSKNKFATAIGANSDAKGESSIAFGNNSVSEMADSIAIGRRTRANGNKSIAFGSESLAITENSLSLGYNSKVENVAGVALGSFSVSKRSENNLTEEISKESLNNVLGAVSVGTNDKKRQIINVAGGTEDTDAVNLRQLKAASIIFNADDSSKVTKKIGETLNVYGDGKYINTKVSNNDLKIALTDEAIKNLENSVKYASNDKQLISLSGGATGTKITNLANGDISSSSKEAINGSQLHSYMANIAKVVGVKTKANGELNMPEIDNNPTSLFDAIKQNTAKNEQKISQVNTELEQAKSELKAQNEKIKADSEKIKNELDSRINIIDGIVQENKSSVETINQNIENAKSDIEQKISKISSDNDAKLKEHEEKFENELRKITTKSEEQSKDITKINQTLTEFKENGIFSIKVDNNTSNIKVNDVVEFAGDDNLSVSLRDNKITYGLNKELKNIKIISSNGTPLSVTAGGKTYKFGDAGEEGVITNKELTEKLKGYVTTENDKIAKVEAKDGGISVNKKEEGSTTTYTLSLNEDRIKQLAGTTKLDETISKLSDDLTIKGIKFGANEGGNQTIKLGDTLKITGYEGNKQKDKFDSGKNIMTIISSSEILISLAKDLTDLTSATFGGTTINNDGVSTTGSIKIVDEKGNENVILNSTPLKMMDGKTITNVNEAINKTVDALKNLDDFAVKYDEKTENDKKVPNKESITLGVTGKPVVIKNLKSGDISESSNQAITGSQIYNFNKKLAEILGTSTDENGEFQSPTFTNNAKTYKDAIDSNYSKIMENKGKTLSNEESIAEINSKLSDFKNKGIFKVKSGNKITDVKTKETVEFAAGNNLNVKLDDKKITYGLNDELKNIRSISSDNTPLSIIVGDKTYKFGDTSDESVITSQKLTETLKGYVTTGKDKTAKVEAKNGGITVETKVEDSITTYTLSLNKDKIKELAGTTNLDGELNKIRVELTNKGLNFGANEGGTQTIKLGEILNIKGHKNNIVKEKFDSGKNIMTSISSSEILISLAKDLTNLTSATFGGTKINNDGLSTKGSIKIVDENGKENVILNSTPLKMMDGTSVININDALNKTVEDMKKIGNYAVKYDDENKESISLNSGSKGTKIKNLGDGDISNKSKDAINGSQLYTTMTNVGSILGVGTNDKGVLPSQKFDNKEDNFLKAINKNTGEITKNAENIKNINTKLDKFSNEGVFKIKAGSGEASIKSSDAIEFEAENNLNVKIYGKKIVYGLNSELKNIKSISSDNLPLEINSKGKKYIFGDQGEDSVVTNSTLNEKLGGYVKAGEDKTAKVVSNDNGINISESNDGSTTTYTLSLNEDKIKQLAGTTNLNTEIEKITKNTESIQKINSKLDDFTNKGLFKVKAGEKETAIKPETIIEFGAGNNLTVENKDGKTTYSMIDKPKFDDLKINDIKLESNNGGLKLSKDENPVTIENVKSGIEWGTDSNDIKLLYDNKTPNNVVTVNDLQKAALAGLNFVADDNGSLHKNLGESLSIKGKSIDSHQNILTSVDNGIEISLNDNLKVRESITVGSGDKQTKIDGNSIVFKDKDGKPTFVINSDGTMDGLKSNSENSISTMGKVNKIKSGLSQGIASVTAMTNIPQVSDNHRFSVGAGVGYYDGKSAIAVGVSGQTEAENLVYKASVGFDGNKATVGAGFNMNIGDKKSKENKEIKELRAENKKLNDKINNIENYVKNLNIEEFKEKLYIIDQFESNSFNPTELQIIKLKAIVAEINEKYPDRTIDIVGHTDTSYTDKYNLDLGLKRATTISNMMIELGLKNPQNIRKVSSFGYNNKVDSNELSSNRRVEIYIK